MRTRLAGIAQRFAVALATTLAARPLARPTLAAPGRCAAEWAGDGRHLGAWWSTPRPSSSQRVTPSGAYAVPWRRRARSRHGAWHYGGLWQTRTADSGIGGLSPVSTTRFP